MVLSPVETAMHMLLLRYWRNEVCTKAGNPEKADAPKRSAQQRHSQRNMANVGHGYRTDVHRTSMGD
jgi:hypothetical protein